MAALSDAEPVRSSATRALVNIRDPQAVEPLIGLLKDFNGRVVTENSVRIENGRLSLGSRSKPVSKFLAHVTLLLAPCHKVNLHGDRDFL